MLNFRTPQKRRDQTDQHRCPYCHKLFSTPEALGRHIRDEHEKRR